PVVIKPPMIDGGKSYRVYQGIYFNESKWDGSDIFRIQHAVIIVNRQVYQAFQKAKIANIRFKPILDDEYFVSSVEIVRGIKLDPNREIL
ncbi:MAG: hypothetical protein NTV30_09040, partial [Chloroflexi bacterium]|nr:hypothetical protein [Chloroflexota bacterium]